MRLFFFAHLSPEEGRAIAVRQLESVEQLRMRLESARPEVEVHADRFQYLCFQFGLRFFEDLARNVSEVIHALEKGPSDNGR
jgi:hypothetical protein